MIKYGDVCIQMNGEIMKSPKGIKSVVPESVSFSCPTCGTRNIDVGVSMGNIISDDYKSTRHPGQLVAKICWSTRRQFSNSIGQLVAQYRRHVPLHITVFVIMYNQYLFT